ncbi:MAG: response regulator [Spirochaetes bacterium]|nr:response regulator [Spirochaetota bacterium]
MKKLIYAIDDEADIQEIIRINLKSEGYEVRTFSSAEKALPEIEKAEPDLIILDIMMDGMDGYEFCRKLRSDDRWKNIPIIFLSAKSEEFDKVLGLELGGDDYVTKPFSVRELISRTKAVLRRSGAPDAVEDHERKIYKYLGVDLDPEKFSLKVDGDDVKLTKTEFELLHLFMKYPGKIFTRDNIIDSIKGEDIYVIDRTIDVHIMNLRKKLGKYKSMVSTFSGVGYGIKE